VPDRSPDRNESAIRDGLPGGSGVHTRAAAKAFLNVMRRDLRALGRRLATPPKAKGPGRQDRFLRAARRPLFMFVAGLAISAGIGVLAMAGAMLWVLHELPLEAAAAKSRPRAATGPSRWRPQMGPS